MKIMLVFLALLTMATIADAAPPAAIQIWLPNHTEVTLVPFTEGMSATRAIIRTGEVFWRYPSTIIITSDGHQQRVATRPILHGTSPDPLLHPGDIITFPGKPSMGISF